MNMTEHIYPELLFILPFLNTLGWWIKHKTKMNNNLIPLVLGIVSFILCFMYIMPTSEKNIGVCFSESAVQGLLLAATSVYVNQLLKTVEGNKGNMNDSEK